MVEQNTVNIRINVRFILRARDHNKLLNVNRLSLIPLESLSLDCSFKHWLQFYINLLFTFQTFTKIYYINLLHSLLTIIITLF